MTVQALNSKVILFPLCDKSGLMQQALQPATSHTPASRHQNSGTRADAIVFAWVLELPEQIHSTDAARAVLHVIRPWLGQLNPHQRSIVAELSKLMRTEESSWTSIPAQKSARRFKANRRVKRLLTRPSRGEEKSETGKLVVLRGGLDTRD